MNCSDRKRQERKRKMGNNPRGVWKSATSVTVTATASFFAQPRGKCSRTSTSGRNFVNAKRSVSGVSDWKVVDPKGAPGNVIPFSPAKLRQLLMWPARIVHTMIQLKGSQRGCITDFVTVSSINGRSLAERKKIEGLAVQREALVCNQARSNLYWNKKMLFWPFNHYEFKFFSMLSLLFGVHEVLLEGNFQSWLELDVLYS